jgi:site-specific DNA recombinase
MTTQRKAREYLRVSLDRSGRARSCEEQHDENDRAATEHGWLLGKPYTDNNVSASRYSAKVRDDFVKLLADLDRDRFGADVLVLWESSRGSRKVAEWVTLIESCEARGVGIYVTTHGRLYDPANKRDRRSMLEDAVDSEYESGKVSDRAKRAAAANAADGKPHGPVAYGYSRTYDAKTKALVSQDVEPSEAKVIRELYARLRKGHSLRSIAVDFEARGVRTRTGKVFAGTHLRDMALSPIYSGLRAHGAGGRGRFRSLEGVELVDGTWPALVERSVWHAVRARLLAPERTTTIPGAAKHLLTFIAVCHKCGGPMASTKRNGVGAQLQCHLKGCVRLDEAELNAYAERTMLDYLAQPDVIDRLRAGDNDDAELAVVRDSLAEARAELRELREAVGAGRVSVASLAVAEPAMVATAERLEQTERELSAPPALSALITPGKDVRRRWRAAPMSAKRDVCKLLLVAGVLGQLRVTPSPIRGHRVPVAQRVVWRTTDGDLGGSSGERAIPADG